MSSKPTPTLPRHIAIIMDGNGRWAKQQSLPRAAGHKAGVKVLRSIVEHCAYRKIQALTVYAFSSENWRRPGKEVSFLLDLFVSSLNQQVDSLHENNVRLSFIGEQSAFPEKLQAGIAEAESLTQDNTGLNLVVAANYGGRWDVLQAARQLATAVKAGKLEPEAIDESCLQERLSLHGLPEPDLFIRTGGEQRVSNYLLWQLAYTELYFTDLLWPDFSAKALDKAIDWFAGRERRFGKTSEQLQCR